MNVIIKWNLYEYIHNNLFINIKTKLIGAIDFKIFENFLSQRLLGVGIDALISDISSNSAGDHFYWGSICRKYESRIFFHLNFFSRFARQKTKIFQKNWILGFFHIYFKARIVRATLNIALIMIFQYMKRNPSIKIYFSTFCQKTKFSDAS